MKEKMKELFIELYTEKYGNHINKELAEEIVHAFPVTDGSARTSGEKWTMQETKNVGEKIGIDFDRINICDWYIVMNNMYSDYFRTAKKHGLTDSIFFAELSFDWFNDSDAEENKTFNYFMF